MGDSYNTWGGKNNSWGNRNKKNSSSNNNYKETKPFKILAVMVIGCILVGGSINTVKDLLDKYDSAKDTVEKIEQVQEALNKDTTANSNSSNSTAKVENTSGIELDTDDIKDILDKISDMAEQNSMQVQVNDIIVINYTDANSLDLYTKNIIDKQVEYDKTVTFAIVIDEILNNTTAEDRIAVISEFMNDTKSDCNAKTVMLNGLSNMPHTGNLVIAITYVK